MASGSLIPDLPPVPILDLHERYTEELLRWTQAPDHASRNLEKGGAEYWWLEYHPKPELGQTESMARYIRYRVPASLVKRIIESKSLEVALKDYRA